MKKFGRYICDTCHLELDPRRVYSVSIAKVEPTDVYELKSEYHFCPQCLRLVETRINRTVEVL